MAEMGHDRSFGDVSSMSGLRESGHRLGDLWVHAVETRLSLPRLFWSQFQLSRRRKQSITKRRRP